MPKKRFLIVEEADDIIGKGALGAFEREDVVGLGRDDRSCRRALAVDGISGDDHAFQRLKIAIKDGAADIVSRIEGRLAGAKADRAPLPALPRLPVNNLITAINAELGPWRAKISAAAVVPTPAAQESPEAGQPVLGSRASARSTDPPSARRTRIAVSQ